MSGPWCGHSWISARADHPLGTLTLFTRPPHPFPRTWHWTSMPKRNTPITPEAFRRRLVFVGLAIGAGADVLYRAAGVDERNVRARLKSGRLPSKAKVEALLAPVGVPLSTFYLADEGPLIVWLRRHYPARFPTLDPTRMP